MVKQNRSWIEERMSLINQADFSKELMPTVLCDFDTASDIKAAALRVASDGRNPGQSTESICNFIKQMPYRYDDWDVKADERPTGQDKVSANLA
jgi:hypothetical protein